MPDQEFLKAFKGLFTNLNPHDTPPGTTVVQDNIANTIPGVMAARRGIVPLGYTGFTSAGANNCMVMFPFNRPEAYWLIYELSNGTVKAIRDGGQVTLRSGMNPAQPICGARERQGHEIFVNGIDRGGFWDGLWAASELLGVDAPTSAATIGTSAGSSTQGATAGEYKLTYRFVDIYNNPSNLAPVITLAAVDHEIFSYSALQVSQQLRCSSGGTVEIYRTTSGESDVYYLVGSTTGGSTAFAGDVLTDDQLSATTNPNLPVFYPNGQLLANRFVIPPTNKPFVAIYRDRAWYYGNVTYSTGTIEVQVGTPTILRGTGTAWTAQMVGRYVFLPGATKGYLISAFTSATQLTLSVAAPTTAAGSAYTIRNGWTEQRLIYYSEQDEPESVPPANALAIQENVQDHDFETGLAVHDQFLYVLHERHIYALWFTQQPDIDASIQLVAERGCINNRCWVVAAGTMYMLDQLGAYAVQGKSIQPISDQIQDYWRDSRLDFTTASSWWAEYEPNEKTVKFFVKLTGDAAGGPTHALCYNTFSNTWSTETYLWAMRGGCRTTIAGKQRLVAGGDLDTVFKTSEGLSDGVTTAILGTATAGSSSTLTDSTASFGASVVGATVAILSGTGKSSIGVITARTSTQLTVTWSGTAPAAGSTYLVGAIGWTFKTGIMRLQSNNKTQARIVKLSYQPTTAAASFDVRRYYNHDTTADSYSQDYERPDGYANKYNDPDATIQMLKTFFSASGRTDKPAPGYNWMEVDDGMSDKNVSDRWLSLEFRGFQGLDRIQIYNAQIVGVTDREE